MSKDPVVAQEAGSSACATVSLSAVEVGFSSMKASYSYASIEDPGKQVCVLVVMLKAVNCHCQLCLQPFRLWQRGVVIQAVERLICWLYLLWVYMGLAVAKLVLIVTGRLLGRSPCVCGYHKRNTFEGSC